MYQNNFAINNKAYENNNNILLGIINELQQIINYSKEDLTIKRISDIIIKINFFFNEYKKDHESIMNQFSLQQNQLNSLQNQLNQKFKINNINNQQELKFEDGRYVGQVVNGLREGKGIMYFNNGDRYDGEWRNNKQNGKGVKYWNTEPYKGDRYEGDYLNDKKEGKGIYYYSNGDRKMGDYYNGIPKGKFVMLTRNGEVKVNNY